MDENRVIGCGGCGGLDSALGLPERDLAAGPGGDHAAPAGRALARPEQNRSAMPLGLLGGALYLCDLYVGKPHRSPRGALDDPAAEPAAQLECEVGAARIADEGIRPAAQLGVQRARAGEVARVQLQVDDGISIG